MQSEFIDMRRLTLILCFILRSTAKETTLRSVIEEAINEELSDLRGAVDNHREESFDLERNFDERKRELVLRPALRHANTDIYIFSLRRTATSCPGGLITSGWVEEIDIGNVNNLPSQANNGLSSINNGVFTANTGSNGVATQNEGGIFWFFASLQCDQGSACDVTLRMNTNTRVAGLGSRENCCNNAWQQFSVGLLQQMNRGQTMALFEEAGGGSPDRCLRETSFRYNHWSGFLVLAN